MKTENHLIRDERDSDAVAISDVTIAAFATMAISDHTEQFVIEALRKAKALTISLVAEIDGRIVGHIAFSPVEMSDGTLNWYALGPVSVHPDFQRTGIGKALISEGLSRLKSIGARGCCLFLKKHFSHCHSMDTCPWDTSLFMKGLRPLANRKTERNPS
jgi:putative acetyltransferase